MEAAAADAHPVTWVFQVAHEAAASGMEGYEFHGLDTDCLCLMKCGIAIMRVRPALSQIACSDIDARAWSAKSSLVFVWLIMSECACVLVATY